MRTRWWMAAGAAAPAAVAVAAMVNASSWTLLACVIAARFAGAAVVHHMLPATPRIMLAAGTAVQVGALAAAAGVVGGWWGAGNDVVLVFMSGASGVGAQLMSRPIVHGLGNHLDRRSTLRTATARTVGAATAFHPLALIALLAIPILARRQLHLLLPTRFTSSATPVHPVNVRALAVAVGGSTLFAPYMAIWGAGGGVEAFIALYGGGIVGGVVGSRLRLRIVDGDDRSRWSPDVAMTAVICLSAVAFMLLFPMWVAVAAFVVGAAGELVRMRLFAHGPGNGRWHLMGSAAGGPTGWILAGAIGSATPLLLAGVACAIVVVSLGRPTTP